MAKTSRQSDPEQDPRPADEPFLVVGLGASAGGINALQQFFVHTPPELRAAYVVILHLSPDHDSRLAEVLQHNTSMPTTRVVESVPLEPGHVYVVSPSKSLTVVDGRLAVSEFTRVEQRRAAVDIFFRALADSHGSRAVCIVLSGTGPNGSNGIKRVKEYGGLAIAQDPGEAEYTDMPRNAIATGLVDFVLPVREIPPKLLAYHAQLVATDGDALPAVLRVDADGEAMRDVLTLLRVRTGQDFSNYKAATLVRRVERRMGIRGTTSLPDYARYMREHPDEAVALMKELLISVTNFFRDPEAFAALEQRVLPAVFHDKRGGDHIRAWVAGCATGEEAYSLAMLLAERTSGGLDQPGVQLFATDLDERAIAHAREGFYTDAEVVDVPEERLQRFFHREGGGYRVRRELREMILFAHHNLIKDPPFSHLDLISCRNLLIYLNRAVQDRVVETFHFALRPGGYLFLGTSESPDSTNDLFLTVDKNAHLYESRSVMSRLVLPVPEPGLVPRLTEPRSQPVRPGDRISPADLHHRLLEQYAPPSIVVTEEHNIVHVSDRAGEHLAISGGEPSRDVLKLVRQELRGDLRTALHQAGRQRANVEVRGVRLEGELRDRRVNIYVRPVLREGDPAKGFFLILFEEAEVPDTVPEPSLQLSSASESLSRQLEEELSRVKGQLRATIEQYETQVEEAKASNEELQAMNEELRSAAEELETSKEELQSVNEELTTVNQELKIKIEELGLTNNDFQNLINSTDIGTIFLDRALRVKLSTPKAQDIFNLLASDIGRPLSDITSKLLHDALHEDVRQVLERLQTIEREVQTRQKRWFLMRILPYRTTDDRIDGVVITFQDITGRRAAEQRVRASEERLRLLIDSATDYAIFTMTLEGVIDSWNAGAQRMFGYGAEEIIGQPAAVLFTPEDRAAGVPDAEVSQARTEGRAEDSRWHLRKNGTRLYCAGVMTRLGGEQPVGLAKIARDLTGQRQAELALQQSQQDLENRIRRRTNQLETEVSKHAAAEQHVTRLLSKVVTGQEDERARIARDLHDHLGQQLTALRLTLERHRERCVARGTDDSELRAALEQMRALDAEIDFLAWEIRPAMLDDLGLAVALPRFVQEWSRHYGVAAECRVSAIVKGLLTSQVEVAFYRVAQEALNNIHKHAHASRADVILENRDDTVVLVIEDDGIGFDLSDTKVRDAGIGLAGMRERAGLVGAVLEVESTPGKGTTIFLRYAMPEASV
ncbi:MAG TPA: CheR family methyltransferase [Vicinamibacterales bacterium]|nr:CheR family methyltransferase [Vicinamibacterales bacterium]